MEHKDDLNQILDRNIAWIENCDSKASIILGTLGIAVSILFAFDYAKIITDVVDEKFSNICLYNIVFLILLAGSLCAFSYGGYKLVKTLTPKIDSKNLGTDEKICVNSIIFFSNIASHSNYTAFLDRLNETTEDDYLNDLLSQIYICSKICNMKFQNYRRGLYFSLCGLSGFILIITLGYYV